MHPVSAKVEAASAPRYPAPVSARRAHSIVELLEVPPGGALLDLGDGPPGLLFDAVGHHACGGVGLVAGAAEAETARAAAGREGLDGRIEFHATPRADFAPDRRFDAVLALGSGPRPPGAVAETAARSVGWLRVGGLLVYGETFLRRVPAPAYRELLGPAATMLPMPGISACAIVAAGFELILTVVLSESEWDAHEGAAHRARLGNAALSGDEASAARRARAERWYQGYWRYGRDTLGYALHAFRKPRRPLELV